MKKHYVTFMSPGTFVAETSTMEIKSWDVEKAQEMARNVKERHGATPYGFYFTTKERGPEDFDSKQTASSNMYYLGGTVLTLAEVKKQMPGERTLIMNMEGNDIKKIIINTNSYKSTRPLEEGDVVLDWEQQPESHKE